MQRSLSHLLRLSVCGNLTVPVHGRARYMVLMVLGVTGSCAPSVSKGTSTRSPVPSTTTPSPAPIVRDFRRIEAQVLAALNRARTDPAATAASLDALIPYFTGTRFKRPTWPTAIQTNEGASAVREAVSVLRSQRPVGALSLSPALSQAPRDHAVDQSRTGSTGHTGSDGSTTTARAARYGTWQLTINENIDYGPMVEGRDVIESLLVDDGIADRGHRRNIYEPASKVVGIACGPHPRYTAMCVIVQAGGFVAK